MTCVLAHLAFAVVRVPFTGAQDPDKQSYHLCIVNLVIGTLYCAKGNFEFGISRIIKSLEPYNKKVCSHTAFAAWRFVALFAWPPLPLLSCRRAPEWLAARPTRFPANGSADRGLVWFSISSWVPTRGTTRSAASSP